MTTELVCSWKIDDFTATAVYTGENRLIRVVGKGTCPTDGFAVTLAHINPGVVPEPHRLHLGLQQVAPEIGSTMLSEVSLDELFEASQQVREVAIRGVGSLSVQEPGR